MEFLYAFMTACVRVSLIFCLRRALCMRLTAVNQLIEEMIDLVLLSSCNCRSGWL